MTAEQLFTIAEVSPEVRCCCGHPERIECLGRPMVHEPQGCWMQLPAPPEARARMDAYHRDPARRCR